MFSCFRIIVNDEDESQSRYPRGIHGVSTVLLECPQVMMDYFHRMSLTSPLTTICKLGSALHIVKNDCHMF